uniref:Uncharacterized protein n=1 Tax=Cacopsylla melanoneura TaxID=428564 RepID=A0A8D8LEY8_9HEMI
MYPLPIPLFPLPAPMFPVPIHLLPSIYLCLHCLIYPCFRIAYYNLPDLLSVPCPVPSHITLTSSLSLVPPKVCHESISIGWSWVVLVEGLNHLVAAQLIRRSWV